MTTIMRMYAIYDHPADYPEHFVVRELRLAGTTQVFGGFALFKDLLSARLWMLVNEPDMVCLARSPEDDPVIVETWL